MFVLADVMSSFYLTLQSNVDEKSHICDFRTYLGHSISLPPGKWEVALTDLSYTGGIVYLKTGDLGYSLIHKKDDEIDDSFTTIDITSEKELIAYFQNAFPGSTFNTDGKLFEYKFLLPNDTSLQFSEKLSYMLGTEPGKELRFESQVKRSSDSTICTGKGKELMFLQGGNTKMFVYCDLIRPQLLANTMAPCLRVVGYDSKPRETVIREFINPHFYDLAVSEFESVHIYILNEVGEIFPLQFGNVSLTLKFREKKI